VPSINDSDRIWRTGKDVKDVIGRLLGKISNDTDDNLIPPIMGYFEDIVDMATKQFVDIKRRFNPGGGTRYQIACTTRMACPVNLCEIMAPVVV
jgi:hypothetical protein